MEAQSSPRRTLPGEAPRTHRRTERALPDAVLVSCCGFLDFRRLCVAGEIARQWREAARAPVLWRVLLQRRWPGIVAALEPVVGPRALYARLAHMPAWRPTTPADVLVHVELKRGGSGTDSDDILCSGTVRLDDLHDGSLELPLDEYRIKRDQLVYATGVDCDTNFGVDSRIFLTLVRVRDGAVVRIELSAWSAQVLGSEEDHETYPINWDGIASPRHAERSFARRQAYEAVRGLGNGGNFTFPQRAYAGNKFEELNFRVSVRWSDELVARRDHPAGEFHVGDLADYHPGDLMLVFESHSYTGFDLCEVEDDTNGTYYLDFTDTEDTKPIKLTAEILSALDWVV